MTVNRSDFQKGRLASVSAADTIIVNDEDGTLEPQVIDFAGLAASAPFTGAFWPNSSTALTGAGLANDDRIPVLDGSVPKYITADELAQGSQFSGRYVAKADDDKVFVPVGAMEVIQGSPAVGLISGRWAGRLFDDASSEDMGTSFVVPAHWATMNIVLYWSHNVVAGTGDVVLYRAYERATGIGYALTTAGVAGTITAVAAPSYRELAATTLQSNISCADATNSLLMIRIGRAGADAADTFAGDVLFFGVMFEKAS